MDANRFDDLIRSLPVGGSRRQWLAAALGGGLGLLGLNRLETSGQSALKKCKKKKGKKKKKCIKKAKEQDQNNQPPPECRDDGDCDNQIESCQVGSCQPICSAGACPANCSLCGVHLETEDNHSQACADTFIQPLDQNNEPFPCATDEDCDEGDLCIRFPTTFCEQLQCGLCTFAPVPCV
jgi:hypothetical protein